MNLIEPNLGLNFVPFFFFSEGILKILFSFFHELNLISHETHGLTFRFIERTPNIMQS